MNRKRVARFMRRLGTLAVAALLGAGCSGAALPTDSGADPAAPEGLQPVPARGIGAAYLKPAARFHPYDAVRIDPVTVAYKRGARLPTPFNRTSGNYALGPASLERLQRMVWQALEREMVRSQGFAVVSEAGPGTLRVSPHVVDLVWEVPPAQGGETSFVRRTGEMTLILDLRDAQTGEPLARLVDRQAILPFGTGLSGGYENSPANNWSAVRDTASHWGRILREALEALRALPRAPAAPQPPAAR